MKILVVDDLRFFKDDVLKKLDGFDVVTAKNSVEALDLLKADDSHFYAIFLDHDLGEVDNVGVDSVMPVVDFMCMKSFENNPVNVDTVYVHTSNPVGGKQIISALSAYGYNVVRVSAGDYFTA